MFNHSVIFYLHDLCHSNNALLQAQTLQLTQLSPKKKTPFSPPQAQINRLLSILSKKCWAKTILLGANLHVLCFLYPKFY